MIVTRGKQNIKYGQVQEFHINLESDIQSNFKDHKILFRNSDEVLQGAFLLSDEGLMVQQSNGSGGLGPAFLIGQSNVNPDDYYLKTTTLNNITQADGNLSLNNHKITNLVDPSSDQEAATKAYVDSNSGISQSDADSRYYLNTTALNSIVAPLSSLSLNSQKITNLADATSATDALNRQTGDSRYYLATTALNSITSPNGNLSLNNHKITNLVDPSSDQEAATKFYVDSNAGISQTDADLRYYLNTTTLNNITLASGDLSLNSRKITNLADATLATDALNRQTGDSRYYLATTPLNSITAPTGNLSLNSQKITNLANATLGTDALNRQTGDGRYYLNTTPLNNITLATGSLNMNTHQINNVVDPTLNQDAATKHYVDSVVPSSSLSILKVLMVASQNTDLTVGNHVKFDTVEFQRGTNAILDTTAYPNLGRITLLAGSYILQTDISIHGQGNQSNLTIQAWNVTDNVALTLSTCLKLVMGYIEKFSPMSPLNSVFTLTSTKVIEIRIVTVGSNNITEIFGTAGQSPAWCLIQQI